MIGWVLLDRFSNSLSIVSQEIPPEEPGQEIDDFEGIHAEIEVEKPESAAGGHPAPSAPTSGRSLLGGRIEEWVGEPAMETEKRVRSPLDMVTPLKDQRRKEPPPTGCRVPISHRAHLFSIEWPEQNECRESGSSSPPRGNRTGIPAERFSGSEGGVAKSDARIEKAGDLSFGVETSS